LLGWRVSQRSWLEALISRENMQHLIALLKTGTTEVNEKVGSDMSKPISQIPNEGAATGAARTTDVRRSALATLVSEHLRSNGLRQVDFCRQTGFDQGLLSKILSSVVSTLNVETALKLAEGLGVSPRVVFDAIGKRDVDEMLRRFYCGSQ